MISGDSDGFDGKQQRLLDTLSRLSDFPLMVASTQPNSGHPSKWIPYKSAELPTDYYNVRPEELVFEKDEGGSDAIFQYHDKIHSFLKRRTIPSLLSDSGGKGFHEEVFFQFSAVDEKRVEGMDLKFIRLFLIQWVEKEAKIPKSEGGDIACARWDEKGNGHLLRLWGGRKFDKDGKSVGYKTVIDSIPKEKVRVIRKDDIVFPEEITVWTVPPMIVDSLLKEWRERKKVAERKSLREFKPFQEKHSALPCVRRMMTEGAPVGKRNDAILDVISAFVLDGASKDTAVEKATEFAESCPERGDYDDSKIKSIVDWVYHKQEGDVFFECLSPKNLGFCVEDCKLKLHRQSEYFMDNGRPIITKVCEDILSRHHFLTMEDDLKDIYHYNHERGIYEKHGINVIKAECNHGFGYPISTHWTNEVVSYIQTSTFTPRERLEGEEYLIHLRNGIFDLENEDLLSFSPDRISTISLPITYDPRAVCPTIERFFNDVFITQEQIRLVEDMIGYTLIRSYKFQVLFIIVGSGSNGKGKFMAMLLKFLGADNVSGVSLQNLESKNFTRHKLHGKLANCYPDLSDKILRTNEALKILTGEDRFYTDIKYSKDGVHMQNYAKMIFSTNEAPAITEDNYAIWRRIMIIECKNKFIAGVNADPDILEKITTDAELRGLFNLAVRALKRLLKRGRFEYGLDETEVRDRYIRASDSLKYYAEKALVEDLEGEVEKPELYRRYKGFCKEENLKPKTMDYVGKHLIDHIDTETVRQAMGSRKWVWTGIAFKSDKGFDGGGQKVIEGYGGKV